MALIGGNRVSSQVNLSVREDIQGTPREKFIHELVIRLARPCGRQQSFTSKSCISFSFELEHEDANEARFVILV